MRKNSWATVLSASIIALLTGAAQMFYVGFFPVCVVGTVLTPLLFVWGGYVPAALYLAASLGSVGWLYGPWAAGVLALVVGVPSAVVTVLFARRATFARRMKGAIGVQLGAMLALIVVLYMALQRDLISVLMDAAHTWVAGIPALLQQALVQQFALTGMVTGETAEMALAGTLSAAQALDVLDEIFETLGNALRLQLPGLLLSSGVLTGVLAVGLSDVVCAHRGDDIGYIAFSDWHMPSQATAGALICLAASAVLVLFQVDGAESVYNALVIAGGTACAIIGAAALDRRLRANGRGRVFRIVLIGMGLLFAQGLLMLMGIYSALLGRQGLISGFIRRKAEEHDREE